MIASHGDRARYVAMDFARLTRDGEQVEGAKDAQFWWRVAIEVDNLQGNVRLDTGTRYHEQHWRRWMAAVGCIPGNAFRDSLPRFARSCLFMSRGSRCNPSFNLGRSPRSPRLTLKPPYGKLLHEKKARRDYRTIVVIDGGPARASSRRIADQHGS